jgi:hypothetical protein
MLSETKVIYILDDRAEQIILSGKCTSHDPEEAVHKSRTHRAFFARPDGEVFGGRRAINEREAALF